ncbi:MAG: ABC transporter permease [Trueperaceae bacterium]|nr:ABC transporter permease [Trueperaceae bacterium]
MFRFTLRRLLTTVFTVTVAMALLFVILRLIPGDAARVMLGPRATEGMIASFRERMMLDEPFLIQLFAYLGNILRGNMGQDVLNQLPVSTLVFGALPHTVALALLGIGTAALVGIPLGTYSAGFRNSVIDRITAFISVAFITTPPFVAGLLLLLIFAVQLGWFPVSGAGEEGNLASQAWHLVLPVMALAIPWIGYISRLVRSSVLEELGKDHVRTAHSKGLHSMVVLYRHTLRGALIPVIAVLGVGFGNLLGGTVLTEIIFNRPGIGFLILNAIESRNYPVVQGGLIVAVFLYAIANLLADLSYGFIDPRIRTE